MHTRTTITNTIASVRDEANLVPLRLIVAGLLMEQALRDRLRSIPLKSSHSDEKYDQTDFLKLSEAIILHELFQSTDGELSVTTISRNTGYDRSRVSLNIGYLEAKLLIVKLPRAGKKANILLTDHGEQIARLFVEQVIIASSEFEKGASKSLFALKTHLPNTLQKLRKMTASL